jgi:hypothetical protein
MFWPLIPGPPPLYPILVRRFLLIPNVFFSKDPKEALLAQGQTQGSTPRAHQQALTTGPFGNTCEADAVSPEEFMRGL